MPAKEIILSVKMVADSEGLKRGMKSAGGSLKKFGQVAKVALVGAGVAAGTAGVKAGMMAADFDTGMAEVSTLSDDALAQIEELGDGVLDLTAALGTDAVEATGALYQAISAGVPAGNAVEFLEIASKAAIGGVTDTETAVDGLTTVMNAFSSQNISAQQAADVMFATVKAGKTNFEQLSASMFQVAPLANAAGVSFEEVSAGLATLTAQGTPTRVATTQLRAAIQSLTKPSDDLTAIFLKAGFASGEAAVQQLGFAGAADIVREATGGSISDMTKLLGSIEGVQAILGTTGDNAEAFEQNMVNMNESTGAASAAFEIMADTSKQKFAVVGANIKKIMIQIGQELLPVIMPVVEWISENLPLAFDMLRKWFDEHGPTIKEAINNIKNILMGLWDNFKAGLDVIWPLLQGFFEWIFENKPVLIAVIAAIGLAIVMAMGPVSLAALAIVGIVALIGWFKDNWEEIKNKVTEIVNNLRDAISNAFQAVKDWFLDNWTTILGIILGPFGLAVIKIIEHRDTIIEIFKTLIGKIKEFFDMLKDIPGKVKDAVKDMPVVGGIANAAGALFGFRKGGSFTVGGTGGPDSQTVAFRATPGERVSVLPSSARTFSGSASAGAGGVRIGPIYVSGNVAENEEALAQKVAEKLGEEISGRGFLRPDLIPA